MYTEEEAKSKWCPSARIATLYPAPEVAATGNRGGAEMTAATRCIGSDCMAWRWRRRFANDDKEAGIAHVTGFCGLAGKP